MHLPTQISFKKILDRASKIMRNKKQGKKIVPLDGNKERSRSAKWGEEKESDD